MDVSRRTALKVGLLGVTTALGTGISWKLFSQAEGVETGLATQNEQRAEGSPLNVLWFGAVDENTGVEQDNGPAIQRAIEAAGYNGEVYIPEGSFPLYTRLIAKNPIRIRGAGKNRSLLRCLDQSGEWLTVACDQGVTLEDFGFRPLSATAPLVAGACIVLKGSAAGHMNSGTRIQRLSFLSHHIGVNAVDAYGYQVTDCAFNDLQADGASIMMNNTVNPDYGDQVIERNDFHAAPGLLNTRAIQHLAGGGARIRNNKFYKHTYAYNMYLLEGVGTGILLIQDNSFETQQQCSLLFERQSDTAGSYYAKITITGNQFNEDPTCIKIIGGLVLKYFDIHTNQFAVGEHSVGIDVVSCAGINIGPNTFFRDGPVGTSQAININRPAMPLQQNQLPTWKVSSDNLYVNLAANTNF